jgi:hypothetical protein
MSLFKKTKQDDLLYKKVVEVHEALFKIRNDAELQLTRLHKIEEIIKTGKDPSKRKSKVSDYDFIAKYH